VRLPKRLVVRAVLLTAAGALLVVPAAGLADNPTELRARGAELAQAEHAAQLELYALQSRLAEARGALSSVESQLASVERAHAVSRQQLAVARKALAVSQERLAEQVVLLYTHESPDALAIFLGASSFEDALDSVDVLQRSAEATNRVLAEARAARAKVTRLVRSLTKRRTALRTLRTSAAARASELAAAESSRLSYIARLRSERVLNEQQIAAAVAAADAAQAAAALETVKARAAPSISSIGAQAVVEAAPPAPPPPPPPQPSPQAPVPTSGKQLTVVTTAYTIRGTTATGIPTGPGVVAVDPSVIPLGTRMTIPGYGEGVAADTGGAIKGLRIDLWVATEAEAAQWQGKTVTITLH
jgi:3D (Asp-Asp-Asp) domain-containing protein/peptidoglycan hydrolase CwlO-like protein